MREGLQRLYHRSKPRLRWLWPALMRGRDLLRWLPVHRIPISSKYFGRPKGFYWSVHDFIASPAGQQGRNLARQIYPAETLRFTLPTPLGGSEVHPKFVSNQVQEMPPMYVCELEDARYWGHYGGSVITGDDRLLSDLSPDVLGPERHKILTKFKLPACTRLNGTVAALGTAEAATNYWHWTFDLLPRLHLLEMAGFTPKKVDYYLINHTGLPFQLETLAACGIRPEQVIQTDGGCHVEAKRLVVTSLKPTQLHVTSWACEFVRNLGPSVGPARQRNRRLYISRRGASFRRVQNEEDICRMLQGLGFEIVHCEGLGMNAQRRLFSEAETVIGPHGAGLSNLVFCAPGTTVIEIFPPGYVDPSMWPHISHGRLRHGYLIGEAGGREHVGRTEDIYVDVLKLRTLVDAILGAGLPERHQQC